MKKVVLLVNEWDKFNDNYPQSSLEDFCRHYLSKNRGKQYAPSSKPNKSSETDALIFEKLQHLAGILDRYGKMALKNSELKDLDWYKVLFSLYQLGESRKSDIIHHSNFEISTGTDIINRLIKNGLIQECPHESDKRSKCIKLSVKGEIPIYKAMENMHKINAFFSGEIAEEDKQMLLQLLGVLENKHGKLSRKTRNKTADSFIAKYQNW